MASQVDAVVTEVPVEQSQVVQDTTVAPPTEAVEPQAQPSEQTVPQQQEQQPQPQAQNESKLHRLCAEGDVMGVRAILSNSLEYLESIDPNTGLTPMLQAIYASQVDVVRELLSAGAYPPPPTVTQDPTILALIFPQGVAAAAGASGQYGIPQLAQQFQNLQPGGQHQPQGQEHQQPPPPVPYYPGIHAAPFHPGMIPGQDGQPGYIPAPYGMPGMQPAGRSSMGGRRDGKEGGSGVLPPAEQAKQIPCRNFPNCRYGAACHFFHPTATPFYPQPGQHSQQPFLPYDPRYAVGPQAARHDGFYGVQGPPPPHAAAQPFVPHAEASSVGPGFISVAAPSFVPPVSQPHLGPASTDEDVAPSATTPASIPSSAPEQQQSDAETAVNDVPSASTEVPAQPTAEGKGAPLSAPAAPFAPRVGQPYGYANGNNMHAGAFDRKAHSHMKKASMNGGRLGGASARQMLLGTWNHGQPPACVFFLANKCRNGDMCKFPHLLPDGTDCRHPDVINGTIPSAPVSLGPRVPKPRGGMMNGGFHYANGPQHSQAMHRMQAMQAARNSAGQVAAHGVDKQASEKKETGSAGASLESSSADISTGVEAAAPTEVVAAPAVRATSRPGTTRSVPNTRAHSPTHSTASYGGQRGGRFSGGRSGGNAGTSRSTSNPGAASKQAKQRVPGAEEFPALSGSTGSLVSEATAKPVVNANIKTAAQVLSEPAVPRTVPEASKAAPAPAPQAVQSKPTDGGLVRTLSGSSSVRGVSTQSDGDAVVISQLPSDAPPSKPPVSRPEVRSGISFASIAGSTNQTVSAALETSASPMVSLQA